MRQWYFYGFRQLRALLHTFSVQLIRALRPRAASPPSPTSAFAEATADTPAEESLALGCRMLNPVGIRLASCGLTICGARRARTSDILGQSAQRGAPGCLCLNPKGIQHSRPSAPQSANWKPAIQGLLAEAHDARFDRRFDRLEFIEHQCESFLCVVRSGARANDWKGDRAKAALLCGAHGVAHGTAD